MIDEIRTVVRLLDDPWFLTGLLAALVVVGVGYLPRIPDRWVGAGALLVGVVGATRVAGRFRLEAAIGAVLLTLVVAALRHPVVGAIGTALVGAFVATVAWRREFMWPVAGSALVTTAVLWRPERFERADQRTVGVLLALGAAGIWASVPDTEVARALLGATVSVGGMAIATGRRLLERHTLAAFAGLAAWATMFGGSGRAVSVFGGWCCVALLAALELPPLAETPRWAWVTAQVVTVAVGARFVAVAGSGGEAVTVAAGVILLAVALVFASSRVRISEA